VQAAGYRIVQEALTNVLRHANARAASVEIRADDDMLTIVIADDGTGPQGDTSGAGAGVRGMRERAEALGGTLDARPGPDRGWRVEAALPLARTKASS
jgi:signal transduction histidine kinase